MLKSRSAPVSFLACLIGAWLVSGCAADPKNAAGPADSELVDGEGDADLDVTWTENDPWEGFNRGMFRFNEAVDRIALKPVATLYRNAVPETGRKGVHNFLQNLSAPVVLLNNILQGDPKAAFTTFWRFVLNSTLGAGGVYDFAANNTDLGAGRPEDFGQTMGVYGAHSGPYLVLPILGPSSARDFPGKIVDWLSDPFNYYDETFVYARAGVTATDTRERALDVIDEIYRTSLDPYATIRSAYLQKRDADARNNTRGAKPAPVKAK